MAYADMPSVCSQSADEVPINIKMMLKDTFASSTGRLVDDTYWNGLDKWGTVADSTLD